MNSIYLLIHTRSSIDGELVETIISAHPTESVAGSAERYFRNYGGFKKHSYDCTYIKEVDFES